MYTQIKKAGFKQFLAVLAVLAGGEFILSYIRFLLSSYYLLVDIITVVLLLIVGYIVFIKYTSVFEYGTDGEILYAQRKIGHRVKRIEIEVKRIKKITQNKYEADLPKKSPNMCCSVFSKKDVYYLAYREDKMKKGLIFEPDENLLKALKNGGKHD